MKRAFWALLLTLVLGWSAAWAVETPTVTELSKTSLQVDSVTVTTGYTLITSAGGGATFVNDERTIVLLKGVGVATITVTIPAANDTLIVDGIGIITISNLTYTMANTCVYAITIPVRYNSTSGYVTVTTSANAYIKVLRLPKGGR